MQQVFNLILLIKSWKHQQIHTDYLCAASLEWTSHLSVPFLPPVHCVPLTKIPHRHARRVSGSEKHQTVRVLCGKTAVTHVSETISVQPLRFFPLSLMEKEGMSLTLVEQSAARGFPLELSPQGGRNETVSKLHWKMFPLSKKSIFPPHKRNLRQNNVHISRNSRGWLLCWGRCMMIISCALVMFHCCRVEVTHNKRLFAVSKIHTNIHTTTKYILHSTHQSILFLQTNEVTTNSTKQKWWKPSATDVTCDLSSFPDEEQ